jgi:hypothetical protein
MFMEREMIILRYLLAVALISLCGAAHAQDCDTTLKPSDGYQELSAKLKCLNDRINALGGAAPAAGSGARTSAAQPQAAPGTQVQQEGGLKFELEGCTKSTPGIICSIFVTSVGADKSFRYSPESRIVDAAGVVFTRYGEATSGGELNRHHPGRDLIGDVRTGFTMAFEVKDKKPADVLSAVQIRFHLGQDRTITFRNVALKDG